MPENAVDVPSYELSFFQNKVDKPDVLVDLMNAGNFLDMKLVTDFCSRAFQRECSAFSDALTPSPVEHFLVSAHLVHNCSLIRSPNLWSQVVCRAVLSKTPWRLQSPCTRLSLKSKPSLSRKGSHGRRKSYRNVDHSTCIPTNAQP
mmetsp:Transcript_46319/g.119546  ORF Transcript_46319/g.119546 Transcript_46319/m.119546 type:complete len:146 (-) Transcript_46319:206-643(-)